MCLVLSWNTRLEAKYIATWLSHDRRIRLGTENPALEGSVVVSYSIQLQHLSEQLHFVSYFFMLQGFPPRRYNTSWWISHLKVIPPSLHPWNLIPWDEGFVMQVPTVAYGMIVVPTMRTLLMFPVSRAVASPWVASTTRTMITPATMASLQSTRTATKGNRSRMHTRTNVSIRNSKALKSGINLM